MGTRLGLQRNVELSEGHPLGPAPLLTLSLLLGGDPPARPASGRLSMGLGPTPEEAGPRAWTAGGGGGDPHNRALPTSRRTELPMLAGVG